MFDRPTRVGDNIILQMPVSAQITVSAVIDFSKITPHDMMNELTKIMAKSNIKLTAFIQADVLLNYFKLKGREYDQRLTPYRYMDHINSFSDYMDITHERNKHLKGDFGTFLGYSVFSDLYLDRPYRYIDKSLIFGYTPVQI